MLLYYYLILLYYYLILLYLVFSVSSKSNFKDPTGSISASIGCIDSKWKSVTHQVGMYAGEDGYDIHVGNGTLLEGAVLA